jgi:hypothetical protein
VSGIEVLHPDQVWDVTRTCFFVKLETVQGKRHLGQPVYKDATGRRFVIVPRETKRSLFDWWRRAAA